MNRLRFGALCVVLMLPAFASAQENLPTINVEADRLDLSLTAPTTTQAERELRQTPGSVTVVPDTQFNLQRSTTIKDVLDYVPGVFAQPKWGEDTRLSIRGSGLSRNFHLRGVQLYMDGIPINTADGYGDFQEIDPSAYRFIEVYKGANALRYGANALGGAINFVTPSGRDAPSYFGGLDFGSFGFQRYQSGTAGVSGPVDYFISGSFQQQDGYRNHSWGHSARGAANIGYQFSPNAETRFYFNANNIIQRIPGGVARNTALFAPRTAAPINVTNDWQRNVQSLRVANKTTLRFDDTKVELGLFGANRHLEHPIFQWLDYRYQDYGGFVRVTDERNIGGYANRLIVGVNIHNGVLDNKQYDNTAGARKGQLRTAATDRSENYSVYAENSFFFLPNVALVAAAQHLFAVRDRSNVYNLVPNTIFAGRADHSLFSPKVGLLWNVDPAWQFFGNISASAEAPSFGEGTPATFTQMRPQRATTFELGTRGRRPDFTWDAAIYHMNIRNEFLCYANNFGNCTVTNADRSIHQGVELGFGAAIWKSMFVSSGDVDKLWLNVAYTFSNFRFDNDATFGNNELPGAPRHFIRAELLYKHPSGFFAGPNMELVPTTYFVDSQNRVSTAAYGIWGFRAGYERENYTLFLDARNLSDKAYIASTSISNTSNSGSMYFEPGNGRAVYGGLRVKY
jgi:iron complex outermembrane receptor protein